MSLFIIKSIVNLTLYFYSLDNYVNIIKRTTKIRVLRIYFNEGTINENGDAQVLDEKHEEIRKTR